MNNFNLYFGAVIVLTNLFMWAVSAYVNKVNWWAVIGVLIGLHLMGAI